MLTTKSTIHAPKTTHLDRGPVVIPTSSRTAQPYGILLSGGTSPRLLARQVTYGDVSWTSARWSWRRGTVRALMPSHHETVTALDAPAAIGPYSHAVKSNGLLFCSGQIPLDPSSGELVGDTPGAQARKCLENLAAVVHAAGAQLSDAVQVTVYLTDMAAFAEVNEVYASFFEVDPPARVAIGVAQLPRGAQVEVAAVVALSG